MLSMEQLSISQLNKACFHWKNTVIDQLVKFIKVCISWINTAIDGNVGYMFFTVVEIVFLRE
jgi:hypothetical protein